MGWKLTPSWVKKIPWWLSPHTDVCHLNVSVRPSTQQTRNIRSANSKYNPSRALVNGFCLFRANIVAFHHYFQLNWSGVETTSGAQSSSFPSLSSSHGPRANRLWRCNAPQASRASCVVSGGVLLVGYGESLAWWTMSTHVLVGTSCSQKVVPTPYYRTLKKIIPPISSKAKPALPVTGHGWLESLFQILKACKLQETELM